VVYLGHVTHYFHKNIAGPKVSSWSRGYRDFEDEREMSEYIIEVFNRTMKADDVLYHLGDWSFGGLDNLWNFRKHLQVKTIHLMLGNHDKHIKNNAELLNCFRNTNNEETKGNITFLTSDTTHMRASAKDLFTSVQSVLNVKHGKHNFFLSHYSHRVWEGSHKGVIHLYGHSHNTIPDYGKSMDVGIDVAKKILGDYRPFSIEEIIQIMDKKQITKVDNH
jgi:calcineurin-like phosphoesterase family protein